MSWRVPWDLSRKPTTFAFRPEAVRLVVISEDGKQAEDRLGSTDIRLVLR